MRNFKEVFKDFIKLYYHKKSKSNTNSISDIDISDYIILRITNNDYRILYLYSGSSLVIPIEWIDLFLEFNLYIVDIGSLNYLNIEEDKEVSGLGYLFTLLCSILSNRSLTTENKEILDILGDICILSTDKFRTWCMDEFNLELNPLVYNDLSLEFEKKYI